jgi:hypothetical protein
VKATITALSTPKQSRSHPENTKQLEIYNQLSNNLLVPAQDRTIDNYFAFRNSPITSKGSQKEKCNVEYQTCSSREKNKNIVYNQSDFFIKMFMMVQE